MLGGDDETCRTRRGKHYVIGVLVKYLLLLILFFQAPPAARLTPYGRKGSDENDISTEDLGNTGYITVIGVYLK